MTYYRRIAVLSMIVALLTVATAAAGPRLRAHPTSHQDTTPIRTSHEMPNGTGVDPQTAIAMTFTVVVDHASAEQAFVIYPPVPGRFSWDGQRMTFTPTAPLARATRYQVVEGASVRDLQGRTNAFMTVNWAFVTR